MSKLLHITNGDGAADVLKNSVLDGDTLPWRDTMHYGPFPEGIDFDEISAVRARYFAGNSDEVFVEIERDFQLRNDHLKATEHYDEVVLWFEHDLLDQLQITQILDWFGSQHVKPYSLTMICINSFEGIEPFRGLGQLNCDQMVSLFSTRLPVTQLQMELASEIWAAFRSPNPKELETCQERNLDSLPFLGAALFRHLEEYPWTSDGLTRTERQIMTLISSEVSRPGMVFSDNMQLETCLFIGDWPTYKHISNLCNTSMIQCEPNQEFQYEIDTKISIEEFRAQRLSITEIGNQVLSGAINATDLIERDEWLGGVHLQSNESMWMWDSEKRKLTLIAL